MPPLAVSVPVNLQVNDSAIVIAPASPPAGTVSHTYTGLGFSASGGSPPYTWKVNGTLPPGLTLGSDGTVSGTPTQVGTFAFSVTATDSAQQPMSSPPLSMQIMIGNPPPGFNTTGSMNIPRSGHAATLLISGKVLVTGGGYGTADPTAELYDPVTGTFNRTVGDMTAPRTGHAATLLKLSNPTVKNYGKVLIVGSGDTTAELYDPVTSTFAPTGSLNHARLSPTATLLNTGKVLIVGGSNDLTAELYDPASETFTFTGNTTVARTGNTATLLMDSWVLIAGGGTATAELYDPSSGSFVPTAGEMTELSFSHTATLLGTAANAVQNGDVLVIHVDGPAEIYDPGTRTFARAGSLPATQYYNGHTASLRSDGTVLVAGLEVRRLGPPCSLLVNSTNGAYLFAPGSDGFTPTGSLNTPRDKQTATVLQDGTILVAGGVRSTATLFYRGAPPVPYCERATVVLSAAELFK
jgi:WD40 repeat protein